MKMCSRLLLLEILFENIKETVKVFPSCFLLFGSYLWFQLRLNNTWVIPVHKQLSVESVSLVWPSWDLEHRQILIRQILISSIRDIVCDRRRDGRMDECRPSVPLQGATVLLTAN